MKLPAAIAVSVAFCCCTRYCKFCRNTHALSFSGTLMHPRWLPIYPIVTHTFFLERFPKYGMGIRTEYEMDAAIAGIQIPHPILKAVLCHNVRAGSLSSLDTTATTCGRKVASNHLFAHLRAYSMRHTILVVSTSSAVRLLVNRYTFHVNE